MILFLPQFYQIIFNALSCWPRPQDEEKEQTHRDAEAAKTLAAVVGSLHATPRCATPLSHPTSMHHFGCLKVPKRRRQANGPDRNPSRRGGPSSRHGLRHGTAFVTARPSSRGLRHADLVTLSPSRVTAGRRHTRGVSSDCQGPPCAGQQRRQQRRQQHRQQQQREAGLGAGRRD